jgi:excisionase family DNA binding protein
MPRPDPPSREPIPVLIVITPRLIDALIGAAVMWQRQRKVDGMPFDADLADVVTMLAGVRPRPTVTPVDETLPAAHSEPVMLMRYSEAAARLAVSERTVKRLVARGRLRRVRLGAAARIHRDDLDAYTDTLREESD